jgi:hypothetical protein
MCIAVSFSVATVGAYVDAIVLGMRSNEFNPNDGSRVLNFNNQPILVSTDIEDDPVVCA